MRPPITWVNLEITSHCDRRCKDCCVGIGINRHSRHHSWAYFEALAPFIYGIERAHLTGGEPTVHPKFAEYVPKFKALFGCKILSLQTDGFGVEKHAAIIREYIDEVHFSHYGTPAAAGQLYVLDRIMPAGKLSMFDAGIRGANFTPRSRRGGGGVCERGTGGQVAYADGKFYGCCVAPGIDGAVGIDPTPDWRERVVAAPLPCGSCFFSP